MQNNQLTTLIAKYLRNEISDLEFNQLEKLLKNPENKIFFKNAIKNHYVLKNVNREFDSQKAYENGLSKRKKSKKKPFHRTTSFYKYAAAVTLLIVSGLMIKSWLADDKETLMVEKHVQLVFDNGRNLQLNPKQAIVKGKDETIYGQLKGGTLAYRKNEKLTTIYNTLQVPFGKRFSVQLSDGTKVQMNAGSSLRFPANFAENGKREVFLKGEAFFEVAKDAKRPYIVHTDGLDIEVLGTEFNVSAYENDAVVQTTLREGSVKVSSKDSSMFLSPNEQSSLIKSSTELTKKTVQIQQYTGWMNGRLLFKDTPFNDIISKLERHYDVLIINENTALAEERFTAIFEEETLEETIDYFSESYGFTYTLKEGILNIK